jgi:hypothetical protein
MQKEHHRMFTSEAILSGLMKAVAFLARPKPQPKNKFSYRTAGTAVHARRRLRPSENVAVNALVSDLAKLDPNNSEHDARIKETINALGKLPVKFVPIKRETRISTSKSYPYRSAKRGA